MTASNGAEHTRGRSGGVDFGWDNAVDEPKPTRFRDWKRLLLVIGLGALSWVATFVGMLELIEANVGDLTLTHQAIIAFSVAMLMVMVVWLLDQIFSDIGWTTRLLYVGGYVFLTLISVGFGFGFYWKVLESKGEASRSAESAVGQVQNALHAGVTRLEQLQGTLDNLTVLSAQKAELERQSGTSCPNSRPGDGPRRQLRDDDSGRFKFAADFVRARVGTIKGELAGLNGDLSKVTSGDRSTVDAASGTRNDYMRGLNRRLDMTATGFNAFRTAPQLRQLRADLAERADRIAFPDTRGGTFQCPDAQLTTALKGVVRAIDELPSLEKAKIAAVEGSEAVIEAFRRLSASLFGALTFKMPPSAEELRELQKKAVQSVEATGATQARLSAMASEAGLSKRDYIPLAIALFVDLCLLLVSIKRPVSGLDRLVPKMRAAERGPVIQILSRFNEIHRDREIRENFEVFRHVVFDFHGDYYAAVPLNTPYRPNPRNARQMQGYGVAEAETLLQEAHLLSNLFASFEKEKIFTRVMSPLLTTSTVQKRLRRQGSKFANAEAFRLYRFRDGAWSEIILGAVMGAARRVETAQRRKRIEEDLFREAGPDLSPSPYPRKSPPSGDAGYPGASGPVRGGTPGAHAGHGRTAHASGYAAGRPQPTDTDDRPTFQPRVVPGAGEVSAPSRRPANSNTSPFTRPSSGSVSASGDALEPFFSDPTPAENVVLHPAVARTGQPSPTQPRDPEANLADQTVPPTAESSAEPPRAGTTVQVADLARLPGTPPPSRPVEPTVTIAATRESVTYTLPVSEARLPASLLGRVELSPHAPTSGLAGPASPLSETPHVVLLQPSEPAGPLALGPTAPGAEAPAPVDGTLPALTPEAQDDFRSIALRFGPATREG